MKLKHNKKRNTAFLFEVLVRELTKSVIQKRSDYGIKISKIVKLIMITNISLWSSVD